MQFLRAYFQTAAASAIDISHRNYQPLLATRPKWQFGRSFLNAKTKNDSFFRFSYFTFENEKPICFLFFVRKFENVKGKDGIYTDPSVLQQLQPKKKKVDGGRKCGLTSITHCTSIGTYAMVIVLCY